MPFHVEIRRSLRRAWAFNLTEERLRATILEPWRRGQPVELGDHEWDPKDSAMRILEGPKLSPPDLAHGQGPNNAERTSADVTRDALGRAVREATSIVVLAETEVAQRAVSAPLEELGVRVADWPPVRARILAAGRIVGARPLDAEIVAIVLVAEHSEPASVWLFDAGLALGALAGRAVLVQLGEEPPPAVLRDLAAMRLDPADPASVQALLARLKAVTEL